MTIDEAFTWVVQNQPKLLHISGKTSTGKSTFANRLKSQLQYAVVESDEMVYEGVINPLRLTANKDVVSEVYKHRNHLDWIAQFVNFTTMTIKTYSENDQPVVLDGAIANPETLREVLAPFPGSVIMYFHPVDIRGYEDRIRKRLLPSASSKYANLPRTFWALLDDETLAKFRSDHSISPSIELAINEYAETSQHESEERLMKLAQDFPGIITVEV